MSNTKYILLGLLALSLSSCGLYGKYHVQHPEADSITTPAYTEVFTDPNLQNLIHRALVQNLDLKMAHERVNQASAQWLGSKLAYLPTVNATGTITDPGMNYRVGGEASLTIDIFGRLYNQMKAAGASRKSAINEERLYRSELVANVASAYYKLIVLDARIATSDSILATYHRSVETLRAMKQAGMSDESAVAQYEGNYHNVAANLQQLKLERYKAENALRLLISDPEYGAIRRSNIRDTYTGYDLDSIPLSALLTRPDVRMAENKLEKAFYGVQLSRANCCPNISLSGFVGYNGGLVWNAVGELLQPIFNSGKNIAEVRSAKAARTEAQYGYTAALVNASVEVNDAMAARRSYAEQVDNRILQVMSFERAYDATYTKFRLGQGSYLECLIALQSLLEARNTLIVNYGNILTAQVDLYIALGGAQ